MKKVLLVSFYFRPCTLTPAQRITYWAENFYKLGIYPIVITREWNEKINSHSDTKIPLGTSVRHEKFDHYEVYYLPFKPGILDKAYLKWGETGLRPLFLLVKILDVILAFFTLRFTSFSNFFSVIKAVQEKENCGQMIISGEPFYLFKLGYLAKRKLGLNWIADYRDDWSTNELQKQRKGSFFRGLVYKIEAVLEKKWVGTASLLISVSETYTNRLSKFLGLPGINISNGYEETLLDLPKLPLFDDFTLVYSGVLYPTQDIHIILQALRLGVEAGRPFHLVFLGSAFDVKEEKRIMSQVDHTLQPYVKVTQRKPRMEAINFLRRSHAVLGITYGKMKGIPSSKLYEYIGLGKPVLLCPSDQDVMEEILTDTGLGFFADDPINCFNQIERIRSLYLTGEIESEAFGSLIGRKKYTRAHQLDKLRFLKDD